MELYVLRMNGASTWSAHQFSIYFVMDGIDSTDAAALNTIFETYMDAKERGLNEKLIISHFYLSVYLSAATYYVAADGDDDDSGTLARPGYGAFTVHL